MKPLLLLLILLAGASYSCKSARHKKQAQKTEKSLAGGWELNYISAEDDLFSFEELYPGRKPTLNFDLRETKISGNTSCNSFSGELKIKDNQLDFSQPMVMTKMLCEGAGEAKFLEMLKKVDTYSISEDNVLALLSGDRAILRFVRK